MQPPVSFESAETTEGGLQRFPIFPTTHSRRLQVAMNLSIADTALTPTIAVVTSFGGRLQLRVPRQQTDALQGIQVFRNLKIGCRSSSSGDLLNTRSATISIYTSTAVVLGCCEML
jgi:hypothetical protein